MPPKARIAFLLEAAGASEIIDKEPLTGGTGRYFNHCLLKLGLGRGDVIIDNTIRCKPEGNNYPFGSLRKDAEAHCRVYDSVHGQSLLPGNISTWDPTVAILSVHPAAVLRSQNMNPLLVHKCGDEFQGVLAKALRFANAGERPVVLMGDKPKELVAPEYGNGVTKLIGHWFRLKPGEFGRRLQSVTLRPDMGRWWETVNK